MIAIKIIVHIPKSADGSKALKRSAAQFHAKVVTERIDALNISKAQKEELLDRVISKAAMQKAGDIPV